MPVVGNILIVGAASSDPVLRGCVPVSVDAHHLNICKPLTVEAPIYRSIFTSINDILKDSAPDHRLGTDFEHHPLRIYSDDGYIDDYVVKAVLVNKSESEITVLRAKFGLDKDVARGFPRTNLEGYGKDSEVEYPFAIPRMSAKILYSFARHWQRDNVLKNISENGPGVYKLYLVIDIVGEKEKRVIEIPGAGPALLRHKVVVVPKY